MIANPYPAMRSALRLPLTALCAALLLAGCANYRGLHTQGRALDAQNLKTEGSLGQFTLSRTAWPNRDWWNALGDPQLDGLIQEALRDSPDMQVASARLRQAQAQADAANAERYPTLDANGSVTRSRLSKSDDPTGMGDRMSTLRSLSLDFSYTFDLWGGQRAAWEAALGQARAAEVDHQAARLTLASNVARAYSQLDYAYTVQDLAQRDLKRTNDMLSLSQGRYNAGLDSEYQLQQTQSLQASSETQLAAAQQDVRSAQIQLAVLLGKGPDRGNQIARPRGLEPEAVALPSVLPAELLGRRPDIVAARWRVEAAAKEIDVSKASFYPNLNLTAAAGTKSILGDSLFGTASRFFNIGPAVSLPLFDAGRRRADLAGRNADYDLAVGQYNQTLVKALGDVGDAITRLDSLQRQVASQRRARDIAESSYDLAMQRYSSGIGSYLDALSIENQLFTADRQLAQLLNQQLDESVLLMQALGGGFEPANDTPALSTTSGQ